jgi:DNA-binding transcriptional regulator LsrR (DeoR family)
VKTIKQIADEIGVSKASIQKRLSREPLKSLVAVSIDDNGVKLFDVDSENVIKQAFDKTASIPVHMDAGVDGYTHKDTATDKLIAMLEGELAVKNKQIEELNARLEDTTTALVAAQQTAATAQALHAGTLQQQLIGSGADEPLSDERAPESAKRGFFGLFRRKS